MNKGLVGLKRISQLKKIHKVEIKDRFEERGYDVIGWGDYALTIGRRSQPLLELKWVAKEGWVPKFIGPTMHTVKDLETVLSAIHANYDSIKNVKGVWELYQEEQTQEFWMKYQGSQCQFHQKANLWGKILDEVEVLKALALEAADLLWDVKKNCMVDTGSEHRVYKLADFKRVNQAIYSLLGKMGYPKKEK